MASEMDNTAPVDDSDKNNVAVVETPHSSPGKKCFIPLVVIGVIVGLIVVVVLLVVLVPLLSKSTQNTAMQIDPAELKTCQQTCKFSLVESIPEGMVYPNDSIVYPSTTSSWLELLTKAKSTVEIAAYYWSLTEGCKANYRSGDQGKKVFDHLLNHGTNKKFKIRIVQNKPNKRQPNTECNILKGVAEIRSLNFKKLVGGGILHTKLWIVDRRHLYIGSANMDWRSLTEVKELGIIISDCPCIAEDVGKIFEVYWMMGAENATVPNKWPDSLATIYNKGNPIDLSPNGLHYVSSSPPQFCPEGRTGDAEAIVSVISKAKKFIHISVMDYLPLFIYGKAKYWGVIDEALRTAAIDQQAHVRLLVSTWPHTRENMKYFLRSLVDLTDDKKNVKLEVKLFKVPATPEQAKMDHVRVNHNKYMVTDNTAYIGTSNWAAEYFTSTGGVALVVLGDTEIRKQLEGVFQRDWNSEFATDLNATTV